MTGIMDGRTPSDSQSVANSRKRKHSEMIKQQLEALKEQNGLENLIDLVQGSRAADSLQNEAHQADDSSKPSNLNDLILASQEVGKTLNSLLEKIQ